MSAPHWLCIQIGARERYAIATALKRRGRLAGLLTDYWYHKDSLLCRLVELLKSNTKAARHPELMDRDVIATTSRRALFDLGLVATGRKGMDANWRRNSWFQRVAWMQMKTMKPELLRSAGGICYAYSYAARIFFQQMRARGWYCVLNQIDGGPYEESLMCCERQRYPELGEFVEVAPQAYWAEWREECALADAIVVNSEFSRYCALENGVSAERIHVIPLAVEGIVGSPLRRHYPSMFTVQRPLRVLYLGGLTLRKGIGRFFDAISLLADEPRIEFVIVGGDPDQLPARYRRLSRTHFHGNVPAAEVARFYATADVFILPTLSDGFARTQLEAQASRLPVIVSQNCGQVVRDGVNGIVLPDVEPASIVVALRQCIEAPEMLSKMSFASGGMLGEFSHARLGERLLDLEAWLLEKTRQGQAT